jgi:hypothetical protein
MKVRNEKSYPVFLRYAGKGRAGRNLRAGEVSPECPNDRLQLKLVQRHMLSKIITIYVTKDERAALRGNLPDEIAQLLNCSRPSCSIKDKARAVAPVEAPVVVDEAPVEAPVVVVVVDEAPVEAPAAPAPVVDEAPAETEPTPAPVVEAPVVEEAPEPEVSVDCPVVEGEAPKVEDQPKSKHLDEVGSEPTPEKTAAELVEDPIKKNAKKKKATPKEDNLKSDTVDYKYLNKKELLTEIAYRGLKKPAVTTSTTRLRDKLIKDDESK